MKIRDFIDYLKKRKYLTLLFATVIFSYLFLECAFMFQDSFSSIMNVASFLTWHNIFETSAIVVSISIFLVSYYTYSQTGRLRTIVLGSLLLLSALVDFFHMLSFKGMPAFFTENLSANRATTFWIIGRLFAVLFFLLAVFMNKDARSKVNKNIFTLSAVILAVVILVTVTYYPGFYPAMYIEGTGLTPVKIILEYIIIFFMVIAAVNALIGYIRHNDKLSALLCGAIILSVFSEFAFVNYNQVYDIYNYLGHIYKAISYVVIFRVAFVRNVDQPYIELYEADIKLRDYAQNLDKIVEQRTRQLKVINKRLMDDLEYARGIQKAMLPGEIEENGDISFNALYFPADRLSGDFYDIFKLDEEHYAFYICDVSGHGVPAAMLTVFLKQCIDNKKDSDIENGSISLPSKVLQSVFDSFNNASFKDEMYIVLVYALYNVKTRQLAYCSAGLNTPPILVDEDGRLTELAAKGLPICKLKSVAEVNYEDSYLVLNKGDKLFFYTDGLIDAKDRDDITYGTDRLEEMLTKYSRGRGKELADALKQDLYRHITGRKIIDDITYFVLDI